MEDFHSLLILMVVVWGMGKIFRIFTLPVIFGELLGGIIVGPAVLGLIDPSNHTIQVLADLGVFFLMLHAGLETDAKELYKGSKKAVLIALGALVLTFIGGFVVSDIFGFSAYQSLFIATAISVTSIAISVRILKDYNLQNTKFGHTILSAAIITDILILITFSIILKLIETGVVDYGQIAFMLLKIIAFFAVVIIGGLKTQKYIGKFFKSKGFTLTLIAALALGFLAEWIGLHVIIGAFLAGLFIREEVIDAKVFAKIEDRIYGLSYSFLGPIFFTSLAFNLEFSGLQNNPKLFLALFIVAFFGKFIGSYLASVYQKIKKQKAALIGLTMNSRGTVDLIIISIGLQKGIIDKEIFSVLIALVFSITLFTILLIRPLSKKIKFK